VTDEWRAAIEDVEAAASAAHASIEQVLDLMRLGIKDYDAGGPRPEIVRRLVDLGGVEARHAMEAACKELERSMHAYRSVAARVLIDEGGMTFTAVAKLYGVSRQMLTRLYYRMDQSAPVVVTLLAAVEVA
jgi:hypothetical protein